MTGTLASSSAINLDIPTRLYAVATNSPYSPVLSTPRYRLLRNPPTVFIHPKIDSTRLRTLHLGLCLIITSLGRIGVCQTDCIQII